MHIKKTIATYILAGIVALSSYTAQLPKNSLEEKVKDASSLVNEAPYVASNYRLFSYDPLKDPDPVFLNDYMFGSENIIGMINLYSGDRFLSEKIKGNSVLVGKGANHEGKLGHIAHGHDEALTRIHTDTLDTTQFTQYIKYGA